MNIHRWKFASKSWEKIKLKRYEWI